MKELVDLEFSDISFKTKNTSIFTENDIKNAINTSIDKIWTEESEYHTMGSGWLLSSIDGLLLLINKFKHLRGLLILNCQNLLKIKKL